MSQSHQTVYLKDYKVSSYLAPQIDLHFDLQEDQTLVTCTTVLQRNPKSEDLNGELFLNGENLELVEILRDGSPLDESLYDVSEKGLILRECPDRFKLTTRVSLKPHLNKAFSGLYKTQKVFCTQMEAQGFRRTTFCLDRPDVLSRYTTTLLADQTRYPVLLSNGNLLLQKAVGEGRHQAIWEDPFPKPCYLFALVAGDLDWIEDSFLTRTKRRVDLRIYVDKGKTDRARFAMDSLKQAMKWDEETYRLEYDLDIYNIVAVDDFNMGAMENKGLNIFNSKYVLASSKTATDDEYQAIQRVIGHEYFHNWSGNRVTCRDWFQLSLKEGLTVYRDQEFSSDMNSRGVKRIEDVALLRARQFPEDAGPMAHPVRPASYIAIDNFYTVTVYEKGAEVIRMLQHLLGLDLFKKGMSKYFELFDGQAATTDDWIKAMEMASGRDLSQFKRWYDQAGTPSVKAQAEYRPDSQTLLLHLEQECRDPSTGRQNLPYLMPLKVGFVSAKGASLEFSHGGQDNLREITLALSESRQTFVFEHLYEKPILSLNREFTAPIHLQVEQEQENYFTLMARDPDSFNRWDSSQNVFREHLLKNYHQSQIRPSLPEPMLEAITQILRAAPEDPALAARLLDLPSSQYLAQFLKEIDPQKLSAIYRDLRRELSSALHEKIWQGYSMLVERKLGHSPQDLGLRSLKNQLLNLLYRHDESLGAPIFLQQFKTASNMTDKMAALQRLAVAARPEFDQALQLFREEWESDRLVMNKWFSVIALSQSEDVFQRVQKARQDSVYDETNPNNAYALLYSFAQYNWAGFHNLKHDTYSWFAQEVIEIDRRNPQVAARLGSCFNNWRQLAPAYQTSIEKTLNQIVAAKPSENLYEIVSRALAAKNS